MHNIDNNIYMNEKPSDKEQMELRRALIKSHTEMPDVEKEWERFRQTIIDDSEEEQVTTRSKHLYSWVAGVAAAIILAIVCVMPSRKTTSVEVFSAKADATDIVISTDDGEKQVVKDEKTLAFVPSNKKTVVRRTIRMMEVSTPRGKDCHMTLPDGTKVWLNADSKISFPEEFNGKERNVAVAGEAYFEVTKDAQHPFIVKTEYFTTTVHGTSFNVCAYSAKEAYVALVSGSVAVKTNDGPEEFITPGQMASLTEESTMLIKNVDIYPLIQWKEGFFYFERDRLVDIMMELGRWYNVNIVFEHEADMNRQLHFVAEHSDSLKDIVRRLNGLGIAKIKLNKDIISIE